MKRSFAAILCISLLLCGCAKSTDGASHSEAISSDDPMTVSAVDQKTEGTSASVSDDVEYYYLDEYTIGFIEPENALSCSDIDSMTEARLLEIAQSDANWYISDLAGKELLCSSFKGSINVIPSDKEGWESTAERLSVPNADEYEKHSFETASETDEYIAVRNSYTEIRSYYSNDTLVESHIEREYFDIVLKELKRSDAYLNYSGEMNAAAVQRCFDMLNLADSVNMPLCREVQETEAEFVYEIYYTHISYGDWGLNDTAHLGRDVYTIEKQTGEVSFEQYDLLSAEIPDTATDISVIE